MEDLYFRTTICMSVFFINQNIHRILVDYFHFSKPIYMSVLFLYHLFSGVLYTSNVDYFCKGLLTLIIILSFFLAFDFLSLSRHFISIVNLTSIIWTLFCQYLIILQEKCAHLLLTLSDLPKWKVHKISSSSNVFSTSVEVSLGISGWLVS